MSMLVPDGAEIDRLTMLGWVGQGVPMQLPGKRTLHCLCNEVVFVEERILDDEGRSTSKTVGVTVYVDFPEIESM